MIFVRVRQNAPYCAADWQDSERSRAQKSTDKAQMRQQEPAHHYSKKAKDFHKAYLIFTKIWGYLLIWPFFLSLRTNKDTTRNVCENI